MKIILKCLFVWILIFISGFIPVWAEGGINWVFIWDGVDMPYGDSDHGLQQWVDLVKTSVKDVNTEGTFSDSIQNIVKYILWFVTLIAVIYIIYAGFRIMMSSGVEEVIKKSKSTIMYVIIGILVTWFAWTIANFAVTLWAWWPEVVQTQ